MRTGRTRALLLAFVVTLSLAVGEPVGAAAGPEARPWTLAGQRCLLVPTATPAALDGSQACPGVRPGSPVLTPVGQCTLNFLWKGTDGRTYIGTAGHCLLEGSPVTQVVFDPGEGPLARDGTGHRIGEFAFAALDQDTDFALIRLDPGVATSPGICRFGGPTGMAVGPVTALTPLHHVGRGSLTGSLVPARTQLTLDGGDIRVLTGLGVASAGDSGSPVVDLGGRAVGLVVATGPTLPLVPTGLLVFSMRIAPEMGKASKAMGVAFDLVTAPVAPGVLQP